MFFIILKTLSRLISIDLKDEVLCRIIKVKIIVLFIGGILLNELPSSEFLISYTRRV